MNEFNNYYCQHNIPAISCSICSCTRVQTKQYNQFDTQIVRYEVQIQAYKELIKSQEEKIISLSFDLEYAKRTIENSEQLPIAWIKEEYSPDCGYFFNIYEHEIDGYMPVYTHPMRELSDKEILEVWKENYGDVNISNFARAILKKANEK